MKTKTFTKADKGIIKKLMKTIASDGHTIWKSSVLEKAGAGAFVERFAETIESSTDDPKYAVFHDGKLVEKLTGVYGLRVLGGICHDLGLSYEDKLGRGSQACSYTTAIQGWLKNS
jgi:hypothetical protein